MRCARPRRTAPPPAARLFGPLVLGPLLLGCSALSDFDFAFEDELGDAGGAGDAGPAIDAGEAGDAGPEGDAGPGADGGPAPPSCPAPCVADAAEDFDGSQGAGEARWRYHASPDTDRGFAWSDLAAGTLGGLDAFVGGAELGVAACGENAGASECAGLADQLVFVDLPGDRRDPAVSFTAASRGVLRVLGRFRLPDGASTAEAFEVSVSRNSRDDFTASETFLPTAEGDASLDALVDVLPGDRVFVRVAQRAGAAVPLGVELFVTRMGAPLDDRCLLGLRFDDPEPLRDACGDGMAQDRLDGIGPASGPTQSVPSASAFLGEARSFTEGQFIRARDTPLDYSGDFTIQFYARVGAGARFGHALYADSTVESPAGGFSLSREESPGTGFARTFVTADGSCSEISMTGACLVGGSVGAIPTGEWHFYRAVREAADDSIRVCVDGVERVRFPVDGAEDLTGPYPPHLGRNVVFNPAYFEGEIDDVRVYQLALPCEL